MNKSKKPKLRLTSRLGGVAFRLGAALMVRKDPIRAAAVGRRIGRLGILLASKHRRQAQMNLKMVFPQMSEVERQTLLKRCFEHFGMSAMEFFRTRLRTREAVLGAFTKVSGLEHVTQSIEYGHGTILVLGHYGNWELLASWLVYMGLPMTTVQRDSNDAAVNSILTDLRRATGAEIYSRGSAARGLLAALRDNRVVAMLTDQNSSDTFLPFLGFPAGTSLGAAVLARRTGSRLIPTFCTQLGDYEFELTFEPPLLPRDDAENPVEDLALQMNDALGRVILEHPEQWLWLHDRWRNARRKGLLDQP